MPRFGRTYSLVVGEDGGSGDGIAPPFHVEFSVDKTASREPNEFTVRVWNLAPSTRERFEEMDLVCTLSAGYAEESGPEFLASGNIVSAWTKRDGPDLITEIKVLDGYTALRDTAVTLSYAGGVSAKTLIERIAQEMKLPLSMAEQARARVWNHGFSFYGAAHDALSRVVRGTGLEWSIQNNTLQIVDSRGSTSKSEYVLSADSGLIGSPERMRKGASEKATVADKKTGVNIEVTGAAQASDGWRATSLLLPSVVPGDKVRLQAMGVNGWFRVEKISHTGDWGGTGDWQSVLDLVDVGGGSE